MCRRIHLTAWHSPFLPVHCRQTWSLAALRSKSSCFLARPCLPHAISCRDVFMLPSHSNPSLILTTLVCPIPLIVARRLSSMFPSLFPLTVTMPPPPIPLLFPLLIPPPSPHALQKLRPPRCRLRLRLRVCLCRTSDYMHLSLLHPRVRDPILRVVGAVKRPRPDRVQKLCPSGAGGAGIEMGGCDAVRGVVLGEGGEVGGRLGRGSESGGGEEGQG
ncbi:hypothetical protein K461DRAFT_112861 [Myriangium duriaei CBS 260.36]|uniref:Uncharacterized protein n=1 Tax=Myriangium duriaei CBS 260.36 TaxID=1168546 RepID=A0A9P4MMN9_9PEZI|nr:hypothetical protein K461DRAFT_112861 [Myriangium duriaei CBS 260.36]